MKLEFAPREPIKEIKEKRNLITAIVKEDDSVVIVSNKAKFKIADESISINKSKVFYTVLGNNYGSFLKPEYSTHTAILCSNPYNGECDKYRPYRPGLTVKGSIINNKFVIDEIEHKWDGIKAVTELFPE